MTRQYLIWILLLGLTTSLFGQIIVTGSMKTADYTSTLSKIIIAGHYFAFLIWAVLLVLIVRQLFKGDYLGLKISGLYLINSSLFVLAWGMILKLALIVMAPIAETKEKSIELLRNEADSYFTDFVLFSLTVPLVLTIINILYLKFIAKTKILRHTLILFIANLTILLTASYISTEYYYNALLSEIDYNF